MGLWLKCVYVDVPEEHSQMAGEHISKSIGRSENKRIPLQIDQFTPPFFDWPGAYYAIGPFDGCQPFEERRWLRRNLSPSVAACDPVLGKDERPTFLWW
jgi:hypothetical protein